MTMSVHSASKGVKLASFDPEFPPDAPVNRKAAAARGVHFDILSGYYKDERGCARYDRFGAPMRGAGP
jgi:hypothetical protein